MKTKIILLIVVVILSIQLIGAHKSPPPSVSTPTHGEYLRRFETVYETPSGIKGTKERLTYLYYNKVINWSDADIYFLHDLGIVEMHS